MTMTERSYRTAAIDDPDLVAYIAARTGRWPALYLDLFTRRVVAEFSPDVDIAEMQRAFISDGRLQIFLNAKKCFFGAVKRLSAEHAHNSGRR